jgi:general secretion pathway protein J
MKASARIFSSGYTLVEMLVALTLLGFIMVLLGGSFQFGARTWEITSREIDRGSEVEAAQGFLRRQLAQILPLSFHAAAAEKQPVFAGGSDHLRFSAPLSLPSAAAGLHIFALGRSDTGSTGDLTLQWQVYRPDWSPPQDALLGEPQTLLTGITDLRLAYYGRVDALADPMWQSEWKGKGLPTLIRIDVAFPESDRRSWPSFLVALKSSSGRRP